MKNFAWIALLVVSMVVCYKVSYYLSKPVKSAEANELIDLLQDPEQDMIYGVRPLLYERPDGFKALGIARYKITGIVLDKAVNQAFGGQSIYPLDVALIWGEPAISDYKSYLDYHYTRNSYGLDTNKTIWVGLKADPGKGWTQDYILDHIANNHVFPANKNVYAAISHLEKGQSVTMKGYLLRTEWRGLNKDSSLSRSDRDCEDFYVENVRVGKDVYY